MDSTYFTPVTPQTSSWTKPAMSDPVINEFKLPKSWNVYYRYEPQCDITSYEVGMIMKLFYPGIYIDPTEFINEHKLNRHFIEIFRS